MSDARSMEDAIAHLCITIWGETPQNHVCGLIEETMEAVAESGRLTEEQAIAVATAAVRRAYASAVPDQGLHDEGKRRLRLKKEQGVRL